MTVFRPGQLLTRWGILWGCPTLEVHASVRFNTRLRRALGRCHPRSGAIHLNPLLLEAAPAHLEAVLCHEAAHVAAYLLYGEGVKPHGPEWRTLVTRAGYSSETRSSQFGSPSPQGRPRRRYEHRCPVCQSVRFGGRPVRSWRCAECVEAGLSGDLVITSHPARS